MAIVPVGKRVLGAKQDVTGPPTVETAESPLAGIVERAAGGDVDAFRILFERYAERVRSYTRIRLGGAEDGDDAVQDVFLAAWRSLASFRYQHEGSFPGWLFGIARHVVAQHRRLRARAVVVPLEAAPEGEIEFEGNTVSRRLLVDELQRLPETQREVLVLRFVAGLSLREAAASMGKSERAVTALQFRALEHLRRRLGAPR